MLVGTAALLLQLFVLPATPDAQAARRVARAAQQRFETQRRMRLPVEWHGGSSGRCDARIGRYCYWYDSTESTRIPEPPAIADARERLLATLDSASRSAPEDAWIVGQRVRYLLEAAKLEEAVRVARSCSAEPRWWCDALGGLALHVSERYAASDSAFGAALGAMPAMTRCEWTDARVLVGDQLRRQLDRADCSERQRLSERLLRIAQPLWSSAANDFSTEILARRTMALLLAGTANAQGMAWGDDSRELLLRYGWSEWFTRDEPSALYYSSAVITGHDREPSYNVIPDISTLRGTPHVTSSSWRLRGALATSRYAPRSITALGGLRHQLARMPRGDSMLVITAFALDDTALSHDSLCAVLAALQRDSLVRARGDAHDISLLVANDTVIASVEVVGVKSRHAARARYTIDPLPRVSGAALSDPLLYSADSAGPHTLADALHAAHRDTRVSLRDALGVYWETDGLTGAVWFGLTVEPTRMSAARRLATRLHLAPVPAPVRLRWQAVVDSTRAQHVNIRLPDNARGSYRIVLTAQGAAADAPILRSARDVEIVP